MMTRFGFARKQTLVWRLRCIMFIRECSWDQHWWKGGIESQIGQREELACDVVSTKASVNPVGNSGSRATFQSYPEWGGGGKTFISLHQLIIGYGLP